MGRRRVRYATLTDVLDDVLALQRDGYQQWGGWSLAMICEHLSRAMDYDRRGGAPFAVPPIFRLLRPLVRTAVLRFGWMPSGQPAPDPVRPGPEGPGLDAAVQHLERATHDLQTWSGPWHDHPVLGRISPREHLRFHCVHAQHHLSFLRSARRYR